MPATQDYARARGPVPRRQAPLPLATRALLRRLRREGLTVTEISARTSVPKSTVHDHVRDVALPIAWCEGPRCGVVLDNRRFATTRYCSERCADRDRTRRAAEARWAA